MQNKPCKGCITGMLRKRFRMGGTCENMVGPKHERGQNMPYNTTNDRLSVRDFVRVYHTYKRLGLSHTNARANALDDSNPHLTPAARVELSYRINRAG